MCPWGVGGEDSHRKQMGVLDGCFVGVAFFSPKRYQLSHTCNALSPVIFSQLSSLKRTAKVPAVDLFKLNTLSGTTTMFLTPKVTMNTPIVFLYGANMSSGLLRIRSNLSQDNTHTAMF